MVLVFATSKSRYSWSNYFAQFKFLTLEKVCLLLYPGMWYLAFYPVQVLWGNWPHQSSALKLVTVGSISLVSCPQISIFAYLIPWAIVVVTKQ